MFGKRDVMTGLSIKEIFGQIQAFIHKNTQWSQCRFQSVTVYVWNWAVCVWCLLMEWIYVWCLPLKWKFESCTKCNSIYIKLLGTTLRVNDLCFNRNSFDRYRLHTHGSHQTMLNSMFHFDRKPKTKKKMIYQEENRKLIRASAKLHRVNTFIYHFSFAILILIRLYDPWSGACFYLKSFPSFVVWESLF